MTTTQRSRRRARHPTSPTSQAHRISSSCTATASRSPYFPEGAGPPTVDGPVVLVYQDADHTPRSAAARSRSLPLRVLAPA
jgi:hypothetical protein